MSNPTVKAMITSRLEECGFDGLYSPGECSCTIGELFACGEPREDCMAGYKCPCSCGEGCDFDIGEKYVAYNDALTCADCRHEVECKAIDATVKDPNGCPDFAKKGGGE